MLGRVYSAGIAGIEGFIVSCEADVSSGLPSFVFTGYLASQVKEAADRVKTAIKNSGIEISPKKVVVNLAPAYMKKSGNLYDLPIAISILCAYGLIRNEILEKSLFVGELSLSGELLKVNGAISITKTALDKGFENIFVPYNNEKEVKSLGGIRVFGIKNLEDLYKILKKIDSDKDLDFVKEIYEKEEFDIEENLYKYDFKDIKGQKLVKRAAIVAVAGRHNIMLIGPAGTGKSMISKALPSIMPNMTRSESIETSSIYSITGGLNTEKGLMKKRPFRSPHHNISKAALVGGGVNSAPGEISLAHNGVLFLDEFAEFSASVIEVLRQPMEDKMVSISRVNAKYTYPADFMLCVATNPCKCGFYPDKERCNCTFLQVQSYLSKISKPILDRIDVCIETRLVAYDDIHSNIEEESSDNIRFKIQKLHDLQKERFKGRNILYNSGMGAKEIEEFCKLDKKDEKFLRTLYEKRGMSVRALNKILKVARTIADLDNSYNIENRHLCEAISYRSLEDKYFGRKNYEGKI